MTALTRRSFVAGGTAAAIAFALHKAAIADAKSAYRDAIVIDGLGGFGNSSAPPDAALSDAFVQDIRDFGSHLYPQDDSSGRLDATGYRVHGGRDRHG